MSAERHTTIHHLVGISHVTNPLHGTTPCSLRRWPVSSDGQKLLLAPNTIRSFPFSSPDYKASRCRRAPSMPSLSLSLSFSGAMEKRATSSPKSKPAPAASSLRRLWRGAKTLFFLVAMLASLLLLTGPLLVAALDMLLPSALYSAFVAPLSADSLAAQLRDYDFRSSLVDLPLLSIARTLVIICVYCLCQGPSLCRWPYLGLTVLCSLSSAAFAFVKASPAGLGRWHGAAAAGGEEVMRRQGLASGALLLSSWALAVAHMVVAYRTSCRERRRLLVYRIDLEAVSAYKSGLSSYGKLSN